MLTSPPTERERMSTVQIRLLLGRFHEDDGAPVVVAAIDRTIWEHWEDADEQEWIANAKRRYGVDPTDLEWREAWGTFDSDTLKLAFMAPIAEGEVTPA
jgi:hypothetical protein